jgi:hypothetical protein
MVSHSPSGRCRRDAEARAATSLAIHAGHPHILAQGGSAPLSLTQYSAVRTTDDLSREVAGSRTPPPEARFRTMQRRSMRSTASAWAVPGGIACDVGEPAPGREGRLTKRPLWIWGPIILGIAFSSSVTGGGATARCVTKFADVGGGLAHGFASVPLAAQSTISAALGQDDPSYHAIRHGEH